MKKTEQMKKQQHENTNKCLYVNNSVVDIIFE